MFSRIREITDAFGTRLRVSAEVHDAGVLVVLEHAGQDKGSSAMLDVHGVKMLSSYIMAARLALPHQLPDEDIGGAYPTRFAMDLVGHASLSISQQGAASPFNIPVTFWDRLYAELGLVIAHAHGFCGHTAVRVQ